MDLPRLNTFDPNYYPVMGSWTSASCPNIWLYPGAPACNINQPINPGALSYQEYCTKSQFVPNNPNPWVSPCMPQSGSGTIPQPPPWARYYPGQVSYSSQNVDRNPCSFYQAFDPQTYNWDMSPYQQSSIYGPGAYYFSNLARVQPNYWSF